MEQKKHGILDIKELGNLQEKILYYLAENPNNHTQAIQKALDHPADQYGSIHNAVEALEKLEYVKSEIKPSQKKIPIKFYSLTDLGVFYALTMKENPNYLEILTAYEGQNDEWQNLKAFYLGAGKEVFAEMFKGVTEFVPLVRKEGLDEALIHILLRSHRRALKHKLAERKRRSNIAMKYFPETREFLKEWRANIDEVL